jgi:putative copper resistance protein D
LDVLVIAARVAQFLGAAVLFGTPLFALYNRTGVARGLLLAAALLTLAGGGVALGAQTASMAGDAAAIGDPTMIWAVASDTQFGRGLSVRLAATLLALAALALPSGPRTPAVALVGAVVVGSFAWTGHGAADEGAAGLAHVAADVLHLLAAGVWIGALAGLLSLLPRGRSGGDLARLHTALAGFSGIGSMAVAVLLLSGLVNSWFLVGPSRIVDMPSSTYGLLLIAKLALFAAMLGLAAANRFRLTPALGASLDGDPGAAVAALRRSLLLETGAGVLVLAIVGWMGAIAPLSAG